MNNEEDIISKFVEVTLKDPSTESDFLRVRETLSRIGIASKKEKRLCQTCHILHKKGRYYIVHFLQMFMLDGKRTNWTSEGSDSDLARRNTICALLDEWGLLTVVDKSVIAEPRAPVRKIKIVPFKEKGDWILERKYSIGGN